MHQHRFNMRFDVSFNVPGLAVAALLAAAAGARAEEPSYAALRAARPDGRMAQVKDLVLERDVFRFELAQGTIHFLAPVGGRTVGAVFLGHGSFRLSPASDHERRQLALYLGAGREFSNLTDSFDELVLLFADDTAKEIAAAVPIEARAPDPRARQVYERWLGRQRDDFRTNFHLRLLADLLNVPGLMSGVFMALLEGKKLPPALAAVDPDGCQALLGGRMGEEDTLLLVPHATRGGVWYLSDRQGEVKAGRASPVKRLAHALHYTVDTTVRRDTDLQGVATVRFEALVPGLRVLPVHLMEKLRLSAAEYAPAGDAGIAAAGAQAASGIGAAAGGPPAWQPAAFIQEEAKQDSDAAVVFPRPLGKGEQVLLRLSYKGDSVLVDAGDKNFVVGARESWYPNLGVFSDPAPFDLTYRVPAGNEIVSVGRQVESRTEGRQTVSAWRTDTPVQVAGFNYGKFKKLARRDEVSGIDVAVYTNPGTPNVIREINGYLSSLGGGLAPGELPADGQIINTAPQASLGKVDTGRLAEAAMTDGINSARLFTTYFGPLADKHVAITQQSQLNFGQSWPALIFMPYIAFLDGTQRQRLGLARAKDFVDQVGYHEFAHQWWGHLVGAESYRDQWLEEGFAEFSAALAVQQTQGWGAYDRFWQRVRKSILSTPPGNAVANVDAGPITQGIRLATERSPWAYQALIYEKGAYVLHMLRMLMWDGAAATPDGNFIAMMHDYARTYGGKEASTADFQQVVERHMVPAMNGTGDGKMDWFFRQWVRGTEVPRYVVDLKLEPSGGEVRVRGTISQQQVSADFRALLPLYLELDKGQFVRFALVPMIGAASIPFDRVLKTAKKARRVLANVRGEVLARD
jgi:hypothetical protein